MRRSQNFPAMLRELHGELSQTTEFGYYSEVWHSRACEIAERHLESPHEFLEWAKHDHHWSFTLAEVMREVWSQPSELAARLLVAILREMRDEQQTAESLSE